MKDITERDMVIWLDSLNISNRNIEKLMCQLDSLQDLWNMSPNEIYKLNNINSNVIEKIISYRDKDYINRLYENIYSNNVNVITIFDEDYPGFCDNHKINFCPICGRKLEWESEVEQG